MRAIRLVALNVFRELVRDRILYGLVVFAVLLIAAAVVVGQLTGGEDIKIIKDLGLAAITMLGLLMAVFIGIGLVWKELERRSIYGLLAKPVRRVEFLLGKYCGLVLTLAVNVAVMTAAFYAVLAWMGAQATPLQREAWLAPATDPMLLVAVGLVLVELMLVTAIALFFSTVTGPFLAALLTLGLWVVGHFNQDLRTLETFVESPAIARMGDVLYYVLPSFSAFNLTAPVVYGEPVAAGDVALTVLYGLVYVVFVLVATAALFERRDFR
jgi:Cu-processing system permease protein